MRDLWRHSYIGVCRGGVCESDLRRRSSEGSVSPPLYWCLQRRCL